MQSYKCICLPRLILDKFRTNCKHIRDEWSSSPGIESMIRHAGGEQSLSGHRSASTKSGSDAIFLHTYYIHGVMEAMPNCLSAVIKS